MDSAMPLAVDSASAPRSEADRRMRRFLRLPENGPRVSIMAAQNAASRSIAISATRCILTYLVLPLLGPVIGLSGNVGPIVGLIIGAISMVAIVAAARRFFAADHKWRWHYVGVGGAIFVLLIVQAVVDVADLVG